MYPNTSQSHRCYVSLATLSAKEGSHFYQFKKKLWYDMAGDRTRDIPDPRPTIDRYTTEEFSRKTSLSLFVTIVENLSIISADALDLP